MGTIKSLMLSFFIVLILNKLINHLSALELFFVLAISSTISYTTGGTLKFFIDAIRIDYLLLLNSEGA